MTKQYDEIFWEHAPFGFACIDVIFDNANNPIDYTFLRMNTNAWKFVGLRSKKIVNKKGSKVLPNSLTDHEFIMALGDVVKSGEVRILERYMKRSKTWLRIKICKAEDTSLMLFFEDITDYKAQIQAKNKRIDDEAESYKRYLKRLPLAVFVVDEEGNITEANDKALNLTGYKQRALCKMRFIDFLDKKYHSIVLNNFDKLKRRGSIINAMPIITRMGEELEVSIKSVKLSNNQYLSVVEDVTQERILERRRMSAHDTLFNILKNMELVVFISDAENHKVLFANEYCKRNYGEVTHQDCWIYKGELAMCPECVIKGKDAFCMYSYEEQQVKSGKWMKWQVRPIEWIDGRTVYMHVATDITSLKKTEEELSKRERTLQDIFDLLPVGLWIADKEGNLVSNNPEARNIWGGDALMASHEFGRFKGRRLPSGEEIGADDWALTHTIQKGITVKNEMVEIETFDGKVKTVLNFTSPVIDENDQLLGAIIVNQEITELKATEDSLQREKELMRITLESIAEGVIVTDEDGDITMVNQRMCDISGHTACEVKGKKPHEVFKTMDEETRELCNPVDRALRLNETIKLSNHKVLQCKDGTLKPIAQSAAPIVNDKGEIKGVVVVLRDVTEERRKKERILYLSYHDALTGLYNRRFFEEELNRLNTKRNLPLSIVMGDVNGLKLTNDAFGHDMGDLVLKKMAATIKKACRDDDIIARWGGDEFILLLPRTSEKETERICRRINKMIQQVKMDAIEFSISFGYETKCNEHQDIKNIMKNAEDYMYRRKSVDSPNMRGNTIKTILRTLHEKTPREEFHSNRVSRICQQIGKAMKLSDNEIYELGIVGLMHDIGKIAISEKTLNKRGSLSDSEWLEIRQHPEIGYRILSASNDMSYVADYVLSHHERMDGSGYPNQIKGHKIPLQSRILAVADAYDAMTSNRPYRNALPEHIAIEELKLHTGKQFDPTVVEAFLSIENKGDLEQDEATIA